MKKIKKKWNKPMLDSITAKELKETIVASACSGFTTKCTHIRIGGV